MVLQLLLTATALLTWLALASADRQMVLALEDDFDDFNLSLWKHQLTLGGGGNWEFQYYINNRTSSFVKDGVLYIQPILLADQIGQENVVVSCGYITTLSALYLQHILL